MNELLEAPKGLFTEVDNQLGKHKYICGETITIADIMFYEIVCYIAFISPETPDKYTNFIRFKNDFEQEEWYQTFKESGKMV